MAKKEPVCRQALSNVRVSIYQLKAAFSGLRLDVIRHPNLSPPHSGS